MSTSIWTGQEPKTSLDSLLESVLQKEQRAEGRQPPSFIPVGMKAQDIDEIMRRHQESKEAAEVIRRFLNALNQQIDTLTALMGYPGIADAPSEVILESLEKLLEGQKQVALKVVEKLGLDTSQASVVARFRRALVPVVNRAWLSDKHIDPEVLSDMVAKIIQLSNDEVLEKEIDIVRHPKLDQALAIYSASNKIARGLDDMLTQQKFDELPKILKNLMTGGKERDDLIKESIRLTLHISQYWMDKVMKSLDPQGVLDEQDQQIVFRSILRNVSNIAESVMKYEGNKSLVEYIRQEWERLNKDQHAIEESYPHGMFSAWFEKRITERLESIPALDIEQHEVPRSA